MSNQNKMKLSNFELIPSKNLEKIVGYASMLISAKKKGKIV